MTRRGLAIGVKIVIVFAGFFLLAYGSVMGMEAALGVAPWHVLHMGLTRHLPVTVGQASQVVGIIILGTAIALGVRPRFATFANMLVTGLFIDLIIAHQLVPKISGMPLRILYVVFGLLVTNLGIASYICAGLGAGPRDSLMLGITRKTGWRVGPVKSFLESSVVVLGFLLGGPVGAGTVFSAAFTGPVAEKYMLLLARFRDVPFWCDVISLPASVRIGKLQSEPGKQV